MNLNKKEFTLLLKLRLNKIITIKTRNKKS